MKTLRLLTASLFTLSAASTALGSDAETSATAGSSRYQRDGTAQATARYEGDVGFARTDSHSGSVNLARGVAVGVDRDGLSLSVSQAVAPRNGSAVATNFNLSIGRDGRVSGSTGLSVADGPQRRSATAGGQASADPRRSGASSFASGSTDRNGTVRAVTRADNYRPRIVHVHRVERRQPVPVRSVRILRPRRP